MIWLCQAKGAELTLCRRKAKGAELTLCRCKAKGAELTLCRRKAKGAELTLCRCKAKGAELTLCRRKAKGAELTLCRRNPGCVYEATDQIVCTIWAALYMRYSLCVAEIIYVTNLVQLMINRSDFFVPLISGAKTSGH